MSATAAHSQTAIRPFRVEIPEEQLVELRERLAETRWPERETVADESQGVQLATMQELVRYWGTEYDFRRFEARLNALPQFITEIDGLDIHFIHVKSPRDDGIGGADPDGHGLVGLFDRATALGGRLEIESPAGGGTLVTAAIPLAG